MFIIREKLLSFLFHEIRNELRQFKWNQLSPIFQIRVRVFVYKIHAHRHRSIQYRFVFFKEIHDAAPHQNIDKIKRLKFRNNLKSLKPNVKPLNNSRHQIVCQLPINTCKFLIFRLNYHLGANESCYEAKNRHLFLKKSGQNALRSFVTKNVN